MVDWRRLSLRYSRLGWQQRLGNLASTLARSATVSESGRTTASVPVSSARRDVDHRMDAPDTPVDILAELAPMQLELGILQQAWMNDAQAVRPILAFRRARCQIVCWSFPDY